VLERFIAKQLAKPSGLFGRFITARLLDKGNLLMNELTLERLGPGSSDRVLEVGFGSGYLIERILTSTQCEYVAGVDLSPEMVKLVKRRVRKYIRNGRVDLRLGSIEALPYADSEFTKLCTVNTLYFWPDPALALAECRRVLTTGGLLVLCFNAKQDLEKWPAHRHGFRLFEIAEIKDLLVNAGFGAIDVAERHDPEQGAFYCVNARVVD
jgi:ubiquinone/menaquinone biosynthesis C-methylase UbiE